MYGEAVNDIVALTTLIAFNGVNRNVVKHGYTVSVNGIPYGGDLITIRHNDTYRHILIKIIFCQKIDLIHRCSNHLSLNDVGLDGRGEVRLLRSHK